MNAGTKLAALNKFRNSASVMMRQPVTKVLVVYDVQVKTADVTHTPLIINYGKLISQLDLFYIITFIRFAKGC